MTPSQRIQEFVAYDEAIGVRHTLLEVDSEFYDALEAEVNGKVTRMPPPTYLGISYPVVPFGEEVIRIWVPYGTVEIRRKMA